MHCHICGEPFFIDEDGIAYHGTDVAINFDADAEHVPYTLEPDDDH